MRFALLLPLFALVACDFRQGNETANAADNNAAADMTPEGPSMTAQLFGGGKPMPLTLQGSHPGGMVLQLTSIQAKPTETVIGVTAINGDTDEQKLNAFPNNRNAFLIASNGERFYLSPPPGNPEMAIAPGQRMTGELVFLGRLPQGQTATLVLNEGNTSTNRYDNTPSFSLSLPLQDAAFSDDGSKKK